MPKGSKIKTAVIDDGPIEGIPCFKRFCKPWRNQVHFLDLVIVPAEEAERLLDEGSVVGVIRVGEDMELWCDGGVSAKVSSRVSWIRTVKR